MNPEAPLHTCHATGCAVPVEPKFLMCPRHWKMVPRAIQQEVWRRYRVGQEIDKQPSPEYLAVMKQAIDIVAKKEATPKAKAAERTYDFDYPD